MLLPLPSRQEEQLEDHHSRMSLLSVEAERAPQNGLQMAAYRAAIACIGLTMLANQIAAACCNHPNTSVSAALSSDPIYLIITSTCILLQICVWGLCIFTKGLLLPRLPESDAATEAVWGLLMLALMIVSWIGLTSVLQGAVHAVFSGLFSSAFLVFIPLLCHYLTSEPILFIICILGFAIILACELSILILYCTNQSIFVPQQMGLMAYTILFTLFFSLHPYSQWPLPTTTTTTTTAQAAARLQHGKNHSKTGRTFYEQWQDI